MATIIRRADSNDLVQYKTGTAANTDNGTQNNEYWVITTTDGTQYYFGLNHLTGWASGDATTNSVWTEPVFATASGQPCYSSTWANSWCQQAYRWNLDYVKDVHGDVISYFYNTDSNFYSRNNGSTANTTYIRGGYLSKIWYGQRDGSVYSTSPAGEVAFTVNGRCNTSPTGCRHLDLVLLDGQELAGRAVRHELRQRRVVQLAVAHLLERVRGDGHRDVRPCRHGADAGGLVGAHLRLPADGGLDHSDAVAVDHHHDRE